MGPPDGVTVVDLTIARAGPTAARQLADLGITESEVAGLRRGGIV